MCCENAYWNLQVINVYFVQLAVLNIVSFIVVLKATWIQDKTMYELLKVYPDRIDETSNPVKVSYPQYL